MNWGDVPTWVAAVIAAVAAYIAWDSSKKSKTAEGTADVHRKDALKAAQAAATAETNAAAAAARSAAALEEQTRLATEQADAAEAAPWGVEHSSGAKWLLVNGSNRPKYHVKLGGPGVSTVRAPGVIDRIDGNSSYEFWGDTGWNGKERRLEVIWHQQEDGSDEPRTWSGAMPARPR
jgi:hypothetical protein